jgi:hypothetical protein
MGEHAEETWQRQAFGVRSMTEINDNVPMPEPKKSARARKQQKPKTTPEASSGLLTALKFISCAQKPEGNFFQTHCRIFQHWLVAFDGEVLSVGTKVQEDLDACPHTHSLIKALSKCGESLSITQLNAFSLAVKSDKFRASIQCIEPNALAMSYPDQPIAVITDDIKKGFEAVAWIAVEGAERAFCASVLLQSNSIVATNGHIILEYWHGINLPSVLIPKSTIVAMLKIDKKLVSFGFSDVSATFWYDDGSYIKTQLFKDKYPEYYHVFEKQSGEITPIHPEFFKAVAALSDFSKDKFVRFKADLLCSDKSEDIGATYQLVGLPEGYAFNHEYLKGIQQYFNNVIFQDKRMAYFSNGNVRGAIMGTI